MTENQYQLGASMLIRIDLHKPDYERYGGVLLRFQVNRFCMALLARWVGFEFVRTPSAWVVSAGFVQAWNEHGV